jgi:hypothetical protein
MAFFLFSVSLTDCHYPGIQTALAVKLGVLYEKVSQVGWHVGLHASDRWGGGCFHRGFPSVCLNVSIYIGNVLFTCMSVKLYFQIIENS